jgi:hypothetical protein
MPEIDSDNLEINSVEDADAALEAIERPSNSPIQDSAQAPAIADEFELTVGGKSIKAKRDQVLQWAQMGYDAPNKIRTLTQDLDGWKKKYSEAEPKWKSMEAKYGEIDKFVQEKPDFWDHVVQSYQQRNQALSDQSNPLAQTVSQLQAQVQSLVQYKDQVEKQQSQMRVQQEDQAYTQTLEGIQKQYPDFDFVTPNAEGKSLEYEILEFAQQRGIKDFEVAFKAFKHDDLIKRAESRAKEYLTKEKQKNTKLGVLGITPTPTKRVSSDHRGKSWNQLSEEVMDELNLR